MALPHVYEKVVQRRSEPVNGRLVGPTLGDIFVQAGISDDLAMIERQLLERTQSSSALLSAAGAHTVVAGGKRLRAALVVLAGRLGQYDAPRARTPAIAIELLHAASLIHDDLVDNAGQRRGRTTVHARWDKDVALMLGDYLFALAANELASEPDPRIIRYYVEAARTMVDGELHPVIQVEPMDVALNQYWRKIGAKTAILFAVACASGIAVTGGTEPQIAAMHQFGYDLGMAFQVVDDVLDFVGDESLLGKPAGNDLREGTLTLPLIYAAADSSSPILRELARTARIESATVPQAVMAVRHAGGDIRAMADARALIERSRSHLAIFPASPTSRALYDIGEFVLARQQ